MHLAWHAHIKTLLILTTQISGFKPVDVALGTSERVYYPLVLSDKSLVKKSKDSPQFGLVVEIVRNASQRVPEVRVRSPLQVHNVYVRVEKIIPQHIDNCTCALSDS